MQHYADVASTQGYKPQWAAEQLMKNAPEYDIPPDAIYTPTLRENRLEIRVQYRSPDRIPRLHLQLRIRSHCKEHSLPHFQMKPIRRLHGYLRNLWMDLFYLGAPSRKALSFREREGWRSLRNAFASI